MGFQAYETVVLTHDIPAHGLRAGDVGAVVEVYGPEAVEVEFVQPTGETTAVLTLSVSDVRAAAPSDVLAVRST
jgi:hypothetical protein